jgi:copper(I)-binding protein
MKVKALIAVVLAVVCSAATFAHSHKTDISIMKPWARTSAPGAPSAGFMMVKNTGDKDDVLLSVSGDFAKKMEVHQTKAVDGVMKMIHQEDGVRIPAGGEVLFKPGSYHLMFMGLNKNFEEGETYTVVLTFEHAGEMTLELPVKAMQMKH